LYSKATGKGNVSTYISPQVDKLNCIGHVIGAVRHRQEPAFSLFRSPYPHTQTLDTTALQPYVAPGCSTMISAPITHLPTLEWRKADVYNKYVK